MIIECQKHDDYQESLRWLLSRIEEYAGHGKTVAEHGKDSGSSLTDVRNPFPSSSFLDLTASTHRIPPSVKPLRSSEPFSSGLRTANRSASLPMLPTRSSKMLRRILNCGNGSSKSTRISTRCVPGLLQSCQYLIVTIFQGPPRCGLCPRARLQLHRYEPS